MQSNPYDHIAIIGTGLIGGSLARLIRHHYPDTTLTGVSRRLAAAKDAVKQGILDYGHDSVSDIAPNVDMAIVCTPIDTIPATTKILFEKGIPLVSDIGSTKSHIAAHPDCRPIKEHQLFVPAHPMAGNELRGFENSTTELLKGCRYLVCPPESNTPNAAYDKFVSWLKTMDFTVIEISPEKHDHLVSMASHLPYFMACATVHAAKTLVAPEDMDAFQHIVSTGFASTTRVSGSDPNWGKDIADTNYSAIEKGLHEASSILKQWRQWVTSQDTDQLKEDLSQAQSFRNKLGNRS